MTLEIKTPTLYKIISMVLVLLCFVMMFLPWISIKVSAWGFSENENLNLFKIGGDSFDGSSCFWIVMLKIFMVLFFFAIVLAIFGCLTDRPVFVLPVAALAILMFLNDMFTCFWGKGQVKDAMGGFNISELGMNVGIHVGVGCWLFLFFGLAAYGVLFYEARVNGTNPLDFSGVRMSGVRMPDLSKVSLGGWTCPTCGAAQRGGDMFCSNCGAKKPEPPRCPGCGKLVKPDSAFCSNCGSRLS